MIQAKTNLLTDMEKKDNKIRTVEQLNKYCTENYGPIMNDYFTKGRIITQEEVIKALLDFSAKQVELINFLDEELKNIKNPDLRIN